MVSMWQLMLKHSLQLQRRQARQNLTDQILCPFSLLLLGGFDPLSDFL